MRTNETTVPRWNDKDVLGRLESALHRAAKRAGWGSLEDIELSTHCDKSNGYGDVGGVAVTAQSAERADRCAAFVSAWLSKHARCNGNNAAHPAVAEGFQFRAFVSQDYWSLGD